MLWDYELFVTGAFARCFQIVFRLLSDRLLIVFRLPSARLPTVFQPSSGYLPTVFRPSSGNDEGDGFV